MKQEIRLHREMGSQIVAHLRSIGEVPEKGILAGQAVDSAITDLFGKGGGVYNDLDVFRQAPVEARLAHDKKANRTAMRCVSDVVKKSIPDGYDGPRLVARLVDTYGISRVTRKDALNTIYCTMATGYYDTPLTPYQVISGFDINSTRVAVDLATNNLVWDAHYEDWLATRQLKVSMVHTPWHTFVRVAKKLRELPNCYANLELVAKTCVGVAHSKVIGELLKQHNISLRFGKTMRDKALESMSDWAPYFQLEQHQMQRRGALWQCVGSSADSGLVLPDQKDVAEVTKDEMALWNFVSRGELSANEQQAVNRLGVRCLFDSYRTLEEANRVKKSSVYVKRDTLLNARQSLYVADNTRARMQHDFTLHCLEMYDTLYVAGQALPAVAEKVEQFVLKHTSFRSLLLGLSLAEQHTAIHRVHRIGAELAEKYELRSSDAFIGYLETSGTQDLLLSDDRLHGFLENQIIQEREPFKISPLQFPLDLLNAGKIVVKELLSPLELQDEGVAMHHCVGGYSDKVRSGRSRILSFRTGKTSNHWSTAEVGVQHGKGASKVPRYHVIQHRGLKNSQPPKEHESLLERIVAYLNMSDVLKESFHKAGFQSVCTSRVESKRCRIQSLKESATRLKAMLKRLEEQRKNEESDLEDALMLLETLGPVARQNQLEKAQQELIALLDDGQDY